MTFTRAQRNCLQELSLELSGSPSAWKKLYEDPNLQIPVEVRKVKERQIFVPTQKSGRFQAIRLPEDQAQEKEIVITRSMTFDELKTAMVAAIEIKNFAELYKSGESVFYEELVRRYRNGTLLNHPFLVVSQDEKDEFDNLFKQLPENYQRALSDYIVPNKNSRLFCVDGSMFVSELIYQNTYFDGTVPSTNPLPTD